MKKQLTALLTVAGIFLLLALIAKLAFPHIAVTIGYTYYALYATTKQCFPNYPALGYLLVVLLPQITLLCICMLRAIRAYSNTRLNIFLTGALTFPSVRIKAKNIAVLGAALLLALLTSELVLRKIFHVYPGFKYQSDQFRPVDTLKVLHGYIADSAGIQKIVPGSSKTVAEGIQYYLNTGSPPPIEAAEMAETGELISDAYKLLKNEIKCPLQQRMLQNNFPATGLDSAILEYLHHPINADGFRSIPFRPCTLTKGKVLLLGDSFTWGLSADNLFRSFADNLLARGYAVYNTGIIATDPVQYQQIAETYVPLLKPDVVVMNIYLGNDVQYYSRKPFADRPQAFCTNVGMLQNDFNGISFSVPDSVYNLIRHEMQIPRTSSLNKACASTSIGTLLWRIACSKNQLPDSAYKWLTAASEKLQQKVPDVNQRVLNIQALCRLHHCRLVVCVIPGLDNNRQLRSMQGFPALLTNIPFYYAAMQPADYGAGQDPHFNNQGHLDYAGFVDSIIMHLPPMETKSLGSIPN